MWEVGSVEGKLDWGLDWYQSKSHLGRKKVVGELESVGNLEGPRPLLGSYFHSA